MSNIEVCFEDVDGDGDREVVVENDWLHTVLRFPESRGEEFYKRRWTWGGRLQSLVYKPTGREFFLPEMVDVEDVAPFGLPDELFALFPLASKDGVARRLKMGVGVLVGAGQDQVLEPLPWSWHQEDLGGEKVVVFRQAADVGGFGFVYEKRYRFRPGAAWFALDVIWENRGEAVIASDWDVHSFHDAGSPPETAWLVAPKRAWVSYGSTRLRTVLKEASRIHAAPILEERVWDRIRWDLDGDPWWYATGPGDGDEFYLFRSRFEPHRGLWFSGYGAYTPQGISHVEVPPGDRAIWGFDVTLGRGGRSFVRAGQDCGLTIDRGAGHRAVVGVHVARERCGLLTVHALDASGAVCAQGSREGRAAPGEPLRLEVDLPERGDYATLEVAYRVGGRVLLHAREIVPLAAQRPTAHLPFDGAGARVFVAVDHDLGHAETDGRYLSVNGTEAGFAVDWSEPAARRAPARLAGFSAVCLVGDAWPLDRVEELQAWVEAGGGLLVCGPFGALAAALEEILPLRPEGDGSMRFADPVLGLQLGRPHPTAQRLMLEPDAEVRIAHWLPAVPAADAVVTLRFTDAQRHPAVAVKRAARGRVVALASRPAWGAHRNNAVWDAWGQYYRAFYAGLLGWLSGRWPEPATSVAGSPSKASTRSGVASAPRAGRGRAKT